MSVAVRATGLAKVYGDTVAVDDVTFEVAEGEIFGLVGPNGAGKTTTLRMLATLIDPTEGEAEVCGLDVVRQPHLVRRVIGYMPDTFGVYDDMRVWEYLDFFARIYVVPVARRRALIHELLALVDLTSKRDAYVQSLSRGMQQRLCLAHALVHNPRVLLLDEPASGLDPRARAELRELLRELSSLGKTVLISSHILPELEELCTAVAIIDRGLVLASGSVEQIQSQFRRGSVVRAKVAGGYDAAAAAAVYFGEQPDVVSTALQPDGRLDLGLVGDDESTSALLHRALSAGHRVVSFAPVASDLEELFLQITSLPDDPEAAA